MRKFLKFFGIFLLSLLLLSFLTIQFFGGKLSQAVITGLNKSLNAEITVEDANVSLLRSFPNLSVNLSEVIMLGSDGSPLLEAKQLSSRIGLGSLFGKTRIKNIIISDGALRVYVDPDGNTNYQLLEYQPVDLAMEGETAGEPTTFAIDDARLENVELIYQNEQLGIEASALVFDATFRGDFGAEVYDMATQANAEIRFLDQGDLRMLAGESLRIGAQSVVNNNSQTYEYKELYLGVGGLNLNATGMMMQVPDGWEMDLNFSSEESTLMDLIRLIPEDYLGPFREVQSRGNFALSGTITERWTERKQPKMDFQLDFTEGSLRSPQWDVRAKDITFVGEFTNGAARSPRSSVVSIERLSGELDGEPFELTLFLENLSDPEIVLGVDGSFPFAALPGMMPENSGVTDGDGRILFQGIQLQGKIDDMLTPRGMARVRTGGALVFESAELSVNERALEFPEGRLILRDNALELDNFQLRSPGNEIILNGETSNFIPVLFADSLNTKDAELTFRAILRAESVDIDELLALAGPSETEIAEAEEAGLADSLARKSVEQKARITDLLRGQFEAEVKEWNYGEMRGSDFRGQLIFSPKEIDIRGQTAGMDGDWRLEGEIYFVESPRLEARLVAESVDIEQFFSQSENFGQEVLVADNLEGDLDSKMYIRAYFDRAGNLDYDRLLVLAGIGIEDGELKDFEMLENFSAVLKARDLERVRFSNLENFLEISNNTVHIPVMFIQSSAMNMTLSGTHTFSHVMDYNIKVNAGQVLTNKIARHDDELEVLPARQNGFFNLYYTVTGNLENYLVETNKRKVKSTFKRSEAQRNRIREELERQFREVIRFIEEPSDWRDIPEYETVPGTDELLDFSIEGGNGGR